MRKLFLAVIVMMGLVSCFKDTAYDTEYILKPSEQAVSGGDYTSLSGVLLYAFAGTTEDWEVASYDDALLGVITSLNSGEQRGPFAISESYGGSATDISVVLDRENVILVAVDPVSKVYAYTDYEVPLNFSEVLVDIVFRTWREDNYNASTWNFVVPVVDKQSELE